ncbi:MAG: ATP-dependent DNA helicase RecG [Chloroflexota bacterium]
MLERLRAILRKEQERGYDDRAVMGGLEALVRQWRSKPVLKSGDAQTARRVLEALILLETYSRQAKDERARAVDEALHLLSSAGDADTNPGEASAALQTRATAFAQDRGDPRMPRASDSQVQRDGTTQQRRSPEGEGGPLERRTRASGVVGKPEKARPVKGRPKDAEEAPTVARWSVRQKVAGVGLDGDVRNLWGISDVYAARLKRLGVNTIRDLLFHFPRRHVDYSVVKRIRDLVVGEVETVRGTIWEVRNAQSRSGLTVTTALVADDTGTVQAIWFNQSFLSKALVTGQQVVLSGRVQENMGRLQLKSPDWEIPRADETVHTGRLVPVYRLTEGLSDRWMRSVTKRAVQQWAKALTDHLPRSVREKAELLPLPTAVAQMHFPDSPELLAQATRRLAFDEFFTMQLAVLTRRRDWRKEPGNVMRAEADVTEEFISSLPFALTNAQRRVVNEVLGDMASPMPMSRLLQGEVGSGKTVVATIAAVVAAYSGYQAVIMAPTEILAEQHFRTVSALLGADWAAADQEGIAVSRELPGFGGRRLKVALLTGNIKKRRKEAIGQQMGTGIVDIGIGTHALIQESVQFSRLGLVIVDEQHRFGVMQRATLRQKGYNPDLLVMTATPIPRTLALTIYGDLDVSIIDELPPGRQEIKTVWLGPNDRDRAYGFLRQQVQRGRQGFIICPLVEESDKIDAKAAVAEHERLQKEVFPDLKLGLLHGRQKGVEKESTMRAFRSGELDVLVSTAVVEVGIDVPNATVMLIEGADRFGLAQLHQFRGRVGRGEEKSYCLLLAESPSFLAEQRLMAITHTRDGFALAEEDLRLRGPGEFFGTRQSGLPDLRVAQFSDMSTLQEARSIAEQVFIDNPFLEGADFRLLRDKVDAFLTTCSDLN